MQTNKLSCPAGCKCTAHSRKAQNLPSHQFHAAVIEKKVDRSGSEDVQELVAAARQFDYTITCPSPLCQVICEMGPHWKSELIQKALDQHFRIFYYDLAVSTIKDAHEVMRIVLDEVQLFRDSIGVPIMISMLFGIHTRERRIGYFSDPARKEINLRKNDRFILTADRRMQFRGCRTAVYCNCISTIPFITPNQTINIGQNVIVRVRKIVRQSIVCTIDVGGNIRPHDEVEMPISTHDSQISGEGIEDIEVALQYGAHSIVVKTPRNRKYFNSIDAFIRSKINESVHILTMSKTSDLRNSQQEQFITNTYDGVIYDMHHRFCADANEDPIVPTVYELNMMRHLHESRKPFYLMAHFSHDRHVEIPHVSDKYPDVLHYYTDGFLVPLSCEGEVDYLNKFANQLVCMRPMEKAVSLRKLLNEQLVDQTASGRLVVFRNAALASFALNAHAIIMRSKTGRSVLELAQFRPACQIFSISDNTHVAIKIVLNKAVKITLRSIPFAPDPTDDDAWHIYQRKLYLNAVSRSIRKRVLLLTDRVIILCKSYPTVKFLDKFLTCTVEEFLQHSEQFFVSTKPWKDTKRCFVYAFQYDN